MARLDYFIKRLLLVIPTFLGITLVCFTLCQIVPGGPVEQYMMKLKGASQTESSGGTVQTVISEKQREALNKHFGFDKPILVRYWNWLVHDRLGMRGYSYKYTNRTAWELISQRFPISLIFGLTGFILTYLICIPLGIIKAIRNGTLFDMSSSIVVFIAYAIPAFSLGMLLKMLLAGTVDNLYAVFPHAGFVSDNFDTLSGWEQKKDIFRHMFLPVTCYVAGNFAVLTLLMKNSLLEQISMDYVRTARAKGCTRARAVWVHALRNSLIPIATGFGSILTLIFAGSVIIERVFDIPGMGMLSLDAIITRDYVVFMGILSLQAIFGLLGNILSDFCYVLIDPRIDFSK